MAIWCWNSTSAGMLQLDTIDIWLDREKRVVCVCVCAGKNEEAEAMTVILVISDMEGSVPAGLSCCCLQYCHLFIICTFYFLKFNIKSTHTLNTAHQATSTVNQAAYCSTGYAT